MDNNQSDKEKEIVPVRKANVSVWGPIYITLNLERTASASQAQTTQQSSQTGESLALDNNAKTEAKVTKDLKEKEQLSEEENDEASSKKSVNILSKKEEKASLEPEEEKAQIAESPNNQSKDSSQNKKITYIYNLIDHGLDCECIDVKGELLIRSALPSYRKISQGIEFEQITTNQIKLIITSRVIDHYQEVFQGFSLPKATFRIWVLGYKLH